MNQLIPLTKQTISNEVVETVSARELHKFLESKQDFSTWVKNRIETCRFAENRDYTLLHKKMEQVSGTKHLIEYYLTLDTAKHFAMLERNEKGFQIREYFIECEKIAKEQQPKLPQTYSEALRALADKAEEAERLQQKIAQDKPKVLFAEAVTASESTILIGELAKLLKQNGVEIGQNRLFFWLRSNGYLTKKNQPTQYAMNLSLFEVLERTVLNHDGSVRTTFTTKVTGKGQVYFIQKFLAQ